MDKQKLAKWMSIAKQLAEDCEDGFLIFIPDEEDNGLLAMKDLTPLMQASLCFQLTRDSPEVMDIIMKMVDQEVFTGEQAVSRIDLNNVN